MATARNSTMAAPDAIEIAASEEQSASSQSEIAKRAYEIYLDRGATPGRDLDDWLQAESELAAGEFA